MGLIFGGAENDKRSWDKNREAAAKEERPRLQCERWERARNSHRCLVDQGKRSSRYFQFLACKTNGLDGPSRLAIFYPFYAASHLRLGDEILAVNGYSLQDLAHAQAVQKLRGAGPTVILRVKPNQTLEGRTTQPT